MPKNPNAKTPSFSAQFATIDPLALILSGAAYARFIEGIHPHLPLTVAALRKAVAGLSTRERESALAKATNLAAFATSAVKALKAAK